MSRSTSDDHQNIVNSIAGQQLNAFVPKNSHKYLLHLGDGKITFSRSRGQRSVVTQRNSG